MEKAINRWIIITALCAVGFALCAFMLKSESPSSALVEELTLPLCEYIEIDVLKLDVTLVPTDEEEIRVSYKSEVPLSIDRGDNSLSISESDEFVISLFAGEDFGLKVYLPDEIYREIIVYTTSGSVKLGGINSEKITVVTNSGDILSEDTKSLVDLISGTGDVTLKYGTIVPESSVQLRKGSAEVIIPRGMPISIDFETDSGRLSSDMFAGSYKGSYIYSFNGGTEPIHASLDSGELKIRVSG